MGASLAVALVACGKTAPAPAIDGRIMLPGAPPVDRELATRIQQAGTLIAGAEAHTRHLRAGAPIYSNRLALESSPYLRQHAHNPVDWRPWGEEAFAEARRLGRPILVSIGYSTCHWCHVMAEESFEDLEIATYMNGHYIAIKVDREERPDVDSTYLKALEAMGRPGGWPLNVWLTPDGEPYFGSTYLPPRDGDRGVKSGFLTLLRSGHALVDKDRERLAREAARVAAAMRELTEAPPAGAGLGARAIRRAVELLGQAFDPENGGVALRGERNKFPADLPVRLLLRYARRTGDAAALGMATLSLERMAAGGIRDHIGGGFHRYSTDPRWRVPHFEKMLYDNALLAVAYLEAYQATGVVEDAEVAREILAFARRELELTTGGGYQAALDADSAGPDGRMAEGLYYTWTPAEVDDALGPGEAAALVRAYYGISGAGNFEGRSVVAAPRPLGEVAAALGLEEPRARQILAAARPRLLASREERRRPHRDGKVVSGWNGLMVSALVRGAQVLDRGDPASAYLASARAAAVRLQRSIEGGRLPRVWVAGRAPVMTLEDHAFVIAGMLDLFEATGEDDWLEVAIALDRALASGFEDPRGGFYSFPAGGEARLVREKSFEDGALPAGNSVQALNLLRLAALSGKDEYRARADRLLSAAAGVAGAEPAASPDLLLAVDWRTDVPLEIVLVAPDRRDQLAPFLAVLARTFVPNRVLIAGTAAEVAGLSGLAPIAAGKTPLGGRATAYVCLKGACKLPARDPAVFEKQIRAVQPLPAE